MKTKKEKIQAAYGDMNINGVNVADKLTPEQRKLTEGIITSRHNFENAAKEHIGNVKKLAKNIDAYGDNLLFQEKGMFDGVRENLNKIQAKIK